MDGTIRLDRAETAIRGVKALQHESEIIDGQTLNLKHSGGIGIESLDSAFERIFSSAQTEAPAVPSPVDAGQVKAEGVAQS